MSAARAAPLWPRVLNDRMGERCTVHDDPFRWVETPEFFPADVARALDASFPSDGLALYDAAGAGAEKRYRMRSRSLGAGGGGPRSSLPQGDGGRPALAPVWHEVRAALSGPAYRAALGALTGTDLAGCEAAIRLCSYGDDCWMDPHTDRPRKRVTHVIYLTPGWQAAWGGALRLLRSPRADDVARRVVPLANSGIALVRSAASWHCVEPVVRGAPERRSILVHFETPA